MKQMKYAEQLVKLCGFSALNDKTSFVTKKDLQVAVKNIEKGWMEELAKEYGYSVKERVKRGVTDPNHLLTLLRRVLRKHNKFVIYRRFKDKKVTKYKYFII
jgi:hypothetical protein